MAHIYLSFDFGANEEKAQQARHKLEMWKQAFRLDKKMLYKFERISADGAAASEASKEAEKKDAAKAPKSAKPAKSKAQTEPDKPAAASGNVKLHLRLALPAHERITEERFLKKFPTEELFRTASPKTVRQGQPGFAEADAVFESLE